MDSTLQAEIERLKLLFEELEPNPNTDLNDIWENSALEIINNMQALLIDRERRLALIADSKHSVDNVGDFLDVVNHACNLSIPLAD